MQGRRRIKRNGENRVLREGTTVYEGRRKGGRREGKPEREVPHFCYHERRGVAGNCRMCRVEREGGIKPVAGCTRPVTGGRKIGSETPRVKKAREGVMERRLRNHPLDCPICDQGGECDLQDQAMEYGSDRSRRREAKRGVEDKERGPVVKTVMTRCIHCTRCVRYVSEVGGQGELGVLGRGKEAEIGRYVEKGEVVAEGRGGNRVDRCPVGALTGKEYEFKGRPWERKGRETRDVRDGVGSGRKRERWGGERKRVRPKTEKEINGEWVSDKSRYAYDGRKYGRRRERYGRGGGKERREGKKERKEKERRKRRKRTKGNEKRRVGTGVDRERRRRRKKEERKGKRKVEARGTGERGKRRRHGGERGRKKGRKRRKEKGRKGRRLGRNREKERPRRGRMRREGQIEEEGERKKRGNSGGRERSKKGSSQKREGRRRKERRKGKEGSKERGETVRVGRGRRSRKDGKEWLKRRKRREKKGRRGKGVNRIHHRGNTMGRRRGGVGGKEEVGRKERKEGKVSGRVGVDEGERKENGRISDAVKNRKRRRSSHGRNGRKEKGRGEKARRRPRRTGVEVGVSRVNTEGRLQKTTGRRKGKEEGSSSIDAEERGEKEERRRRSERSGKWETKAEKGYARGWNTRRNENRYDTYREGHRVNRASKVMAKWSSQRTKENR